jgi:hypothetical protein
MTKGQSKEYGRARLKMLHGELSDDYSKWIAGATEIINMQSARIAELERKVEALSMPRYIG